MSKYAAACLVAVIAPVCIHAGEITGRIFELPGNLRPDRTLTGLTVSIQIRDPANELRQTFPRVTPGKARDGEPSLTLKDSTYRLSIPDTLFRKVQGAIPDGRVSLVFTAGGEARMSSVPGNVVDKKNPVTVDLVLPLDPDPVTDHIITPCCEPMWYFCPPQQKRFRLFFWR